MFNNKISRRNLLRYFSATAGCFIASASLTGLTGCAQPNNASPSQALFPQGVASGDPQTDAVILWTRVESALRSVDLTVQLAADENFVTLLAEQQILAEVEWDHTVRVLIDGLEPDTHYYYRFMTQDGSASRTGRTRTSPKEDSDKALNIAVFSCQDYEQGFFTAYRQMILDDASAPEHKKIDFILHVGDFIYEAIRGPETVGETDLRGNQIDLNNPDGTRRRVGTFPSGGKQNKRKWIIPTGLEDFRHLYKVYMTDPDLQDARALFPFVQTWDDHELDNDYWQSYYKTQSVADIKVASNKAWFEFIPAALSMGGRDNADHHAKDFSFAPVSNAPAEDFDENYLSREPNNLAAIGTMTIYRSVRWGKMAELFVVDGRSYRGPRGLPQELLTIGRHPYPEGPIDPELINIMNEGRNYNGGNPPEKVTYLGQLIDNPRKDAPLGSMLGEKQKKWLQSGLKSSQAKWKLLGFNVGLMRHGFDDSFREGGGLNKILWTDGWDGYPAERRELTQFVNSEQLSNVVCLTGDRHAHMAGYVYDDFDSDKPEIVMTELAGTSVNAPCRLIIQKVLMEHDIELAQLTSFRPSEGVPLQPNLNAWMLHGAKTARAAYNGQSQEEALKLSDTAVSPHLKYMDTDAYGFFRVHFNNEEAHAEFVSVAEPILSETQPARRVVEFQIPLQNKSERPVIRLTKVQGEQPFLGLKT